MPISSAGLTPSASSFDSQYAHDTDGRIAQPEPIATRHNPTGIAQRDAWSRAPQGRALRAPTPSMTQRVLAGRVGDFLPQAAAGLMVVGAAGAAVGGGFAAKAVSDALEGHAWGGCRLQYNEAPAHQCDNSINDFWFPLSGTVPELAIAASLLHQAPKVGRAVQRQVSEARAAVAQHEQNPGV
jgi:hypothetical protein